MRLELNTAQKSVCGILLFYSIGPSGSSIPASLGVWNSLILNYISIYNQCLRLHTRIEAAIYLTLARDVWSSVRQEPS